MKKVREKGCQASLGKSLKPIGPITKFKKNACLWGCVYCKSHHRALNPVIIWCTLAWFWSYTNKITHPPRNCKLFLASGLRWLQQKTFISFPSCLPRLCPVAPTGAGGVMGAGSAQRVPLSQGGPRGPHIPSGKPLRTPPMVTHTHKPRTSAAPASPDVGHEGLDVPRQHGDHIGDDEGGRGPADEQSGHESHAGHAAHEHRRPGPGQRGRTDGRAAGTGCPRPPRRPGDAPPGKALPSLHFRFSAALPAPDGRGQPRAPSPAAAGALRSVCGCRTFPVSRPLPALRPHTPRRGREAGGETLPAPLAGA